MKSLPHVVYIAFGFMDGMDLTYQEDQYIEKMSNFISTL